MFLKTLIYYNSYRAILCPSVPVANGHDRSVPVPTEFAERSLETLYLDKCVKTCYDSLHIPIIMYNLNFRVRIIEIFS